MAATMMTLRCCMDGSNLALMFLPGRYGCLPGRALGCGYVMRAAAPITRDNQTESAKRLMIDKLSGKATARPPSRVPYTGRGFATRRTMRLHYRLTEP